MVRRRASAVSNHVAPMSPILRDARKERAPQDEERHRPTRVQVSPPQSGPTQPSTLSESGPNTEMLLA